MEKKRVIPAIKAGWRRWHTFLSIFLGLVVIGFSIYFFINYIYFFPCSNQACFDNYLSACKRAEFTSSGSKIMKYNIIGKEDEECIVMIKLLGGEYSTQELTLLKNKEMACAVPFGKALTPEEDISKCHGELKEIIQDIIISRLNNYVAQNIGKINYDLYKRLSNIA